MRTRAVGIVAAVALLAGVAAAAPAAEAGRPLPRLAACRDQGLAHRSTADDVRFRAAVVCLIGRIRASQGLNVLRRDARLEKVGQAVSAGRAREGFLGHLGEPDVVIPRQIKRAGYRAQAVDEGIGWGEEGTSTPFEVVSGMMVQYDACAQILDPRLRDVGVGVVAATPAQTYDGTPTLHVTTEYGLKATDRPPATVRRTRPATTCTHRLAGGVTKQGDSLADKALPGPGRPVLRGYPVVNNPGQIMLTIACVGTTDCSFDLFFKLLHDTEPHKGGNGYELAHGTRAQYRFTREEAAIARELAGPDPGVELILRVGDDARFTKHPLHATPD